MNSPKRAFYFLLGGLGLTILGGVGVFKLFDSQLATLNEDVGKLLAEQEAIGEQIKIYETAEAKVEELNFVEELSDKVLPTSKEQANVVAELKKFIVDAGLQFASVTFSGSELGAGGLNVSQTQASTNLKIPGVRVLPVTAVIEAGASYSDIIQLLQTIENNQRKMQVTDISLTPEPASSTFASITMQIDVYVRPEATAVTPTTTAPTSPTTTGGRE